MKSKRYKNLPEKTKELPAQSIEKVLPLFFSLKVSPIQKIIFSFAFKDMFKICWACFKAFRVWKNHQKT